MDNTQRKTRQRNRYRNKLYLKKCNICGVLFWGTKGQGNCESHFKLKSGHRHKSINPEEYKKYINGISRRTYHKRLKNKLCGKCNKPFMGTERQVLCDDCGIRNRQHRTWSKCNNCGTPIKSPQKFCSPQCFYEHRKKNIKEMWNICMACGRKFLVNGKHNNNAVYCSFECYEKHYLHGDKRRRKIGRKKGKNRAQSIGSKRWRGRVFQRDGFKCAFCGSTDKMVAHHIVAWADDANMRFNISNGITLCGACHKDIHGGNFNKPINYEYTKNKCEKKGIRLRKKISNRIEGLIRERGNRHSKESK